MGQSETQHQANDASVKNNEATTKSKVKKAWYKNVAIWCVLGGVVAVAVVVAVILSMLNKKTYEIIDLKGKTVKTACEVAKSNGWNPYITVWSSGNDYRQGDCYSELVVQDYDYDGGYCWGISSSSSTKKNVCIDVYDNGYTGPDSDASAETEEEVELEENESAIQAETNSGMEQQPQTSSSSNSEWKQFLKDYEAWVDKYVTFMKKYQSATPSDMASMMSEYSSLLTDLTMWSEKTQNMQSGLSGSDLTEYLNALTRISQKLNSF